MTTSKTTLFSSKALSRRESPSQSTRRGMTRRTMAAAALLALTAFGAPESAMAQGAYTAPWQRACVVYIADLDSPDHTWIQRQFYNFVEFAAESLAYGYLGGKYRSITVVKGGNATRLGLPATLARVASNPYVNTVDLLFVTHGLSERVFFSDTDVTMATVTNDIRNRVPWALRRKFRMVFSTACYGESHRTGWLSAGFEIASGARRIYADAALSYPAFLSAWAANASFAQAVDVSNLVDPARAQDQIAEIVLRSWGHRLWWDVDSRRLRSGRTWMRIYHRPY